MDSNYYMAPEDAGSEPSEAPDQENSQEQSSEGETALVPASFFGGKELKPGDRCEIEVVHGYNDEVEIKYIPHSEDEENAEKQGSKESSGSSMDQAMSGMDQMAANNEA